MTARRKPPVPFYWWPFWMVLLLLGLIVFYGFFTPMWMVIRAIAWLSERRRRRHPARVAV